MLACVNVSGIQGAFDGAGCKTVIPRKVIGKFSIRLVPHMEPATVERLVVDYLTDIHKKRDSPNVVKYVLNQLHGFEKQAKFCFLPVSLVKTVFKRI